MILNGREMAHILIADTPQSVVSLKIILEGHELIIASTIEEAMADLQKETYDLIIVGVHFDNSQMFELMRHVHASPNNAGKPIISFSARDTEMTRIIHESIELASKTAGAWMYLDAHSYNVYREPEEELRRVIERCLTEEARKDIQQKRLEIQKQRAELQRLRTMLKAQAWSPGLEEYLTGLRIDLEVLLQEVHKLQSSADGHRANVAASRQLKDRVSTEVANNENGMERTERIQHMDEARQSIQEQQIVGEEDEQRRKRQPYKDKPGS
jgi:response regulator RpfG family c-di-GMP phosphodiesterase